tara:strand:- start:709 stop:1128 length:420 start_codon:yes stop_codon:yes gene_type:complete
VIKKKDHSQKNKEIWESYIKDPSDIFDKESNQYSDLKKNNRYKFDLHGFSLDGANKKVKEIILYCVSKKYKEILFITGKGKHSSNEKDIYVSKDLGKLKYSVPDFIKSNQELKNFIFSIDKADLKDGGEGAILIRLKSL